MGSKHKREILQSGIRFRDGKYITASEVEKASFVSMAKYVSTLSSTSKVICKVCGKVILKENITPHIESCWGIKNPDLENLSINPPPEAYEHYRNLDRLDNKLESTTPVTDTEKENQNNEKAS